MQISALSVRQLNVQGLVIYMTLDLERRDFRGPGQLRFQLQPQIHSHHLHCHFQPGRLATIVLVELPNYGSCVHSEKHLAILSLCWRGKKHSGQTLALPWRWTRKAPLKEATSKNGQEEVGGLCWRLHVH